MNIDFDTIRNITDTIIDAAEDLSRDIKGILESKDEKLILDLESFFFDPRRYKR